MKLCVSMRDWFTALVSAWLQINSNKQKRKEKPFSARHLLTYPKFAFKIEGIQQFNDVVVVAGGQDVNLYHVILQFILCLCVNNLCSSEGPILLVLGLKATLMTKIVNRLYPHNTKHIN